MDFSSHRYRSISTQASATAERRSQLLDIYLRCIPQHSDRNLRYTRFFQRQYLLNRILRSPSHSVCRQKRIVQFKLARFALCSPGQCLFQALRLYLITVPNSRQCGGGRLISFPKRAQRFPDGITSSFPGHIPIFVQCAWEILCYLCWALS